MSLLRWLNELWQRWFRDRHRLRRISLTLYRGRHNRKGRKMVLTVKLGSTVTALLEGHSVINGAVVPDTAKIAFSSNNNSVAFLPDSADVPPGGASSFAVPVTVLAVGSADIHVIVTTEDGSHYEDTATLIVEPLPIPGLARVSLTLQAA